jgi:hypothetical protein
VAPCLHQLPPEVEVVLQVVLGAIRVRHVTRVADRPFYDTPCSANRIDPNKIPSVPFAIYRCLWFPDRLSDRLLVITGGLRLDSLRTCSSTRLKFHTRTMPPQSLTPRATTR